MIHGRVTNSSRRPIHAFAMAAGVAAMGVVPFGHSARAAQDYTAWQEITVLTVSKLQAAAAGCGFTVNKQRLDVLLTSADLTLDEIQSHPRSAALRQQIESYAAGFHGDRESACATALADFGPDADPGVRDLLLR